jgi:hypothetical protein
MAWFEAGDNDSTITEMFQNLSRIARMATFENDTIGKVERQATAKTLEIPEVHNTRDSGRYHSAEGATHRFRPSRTAGRCAT